MLGIQQALQIDEWKEPVMKLWVLEAFAQYGELLRIR